MFQGWLLSVIAFCYIALLFVIAWRGDHRATVSGAARRRPIVYSLTLAVYCTSWTVFGAVGDAAHSSYGMFPIFVGPLLVALLFWPVLNKMIRVAKLQNVTSLADFIASRYGKSQALAAFTGLAALIATLPYIALQIKAISLSVDIFTNANGSLDFSLRNDTAFYLAPLLALFAILFGTRHTNATEHHEGIIQAIAFESIFKLLVILILGAAAVWLAWNGSHLFSTPVDPSTLPSTYSSHNAVTHHDSRGSWVQVLLAMAAVFCVPRQFHVTVVEHTHEDDARRARWLFPGYMLLAMLCLLPLTHICLALFGNTAIDPDTYLMMLPIAMDSHWLGMLTFIGGFAAGSGMVVMASVTLSIMISNEVIIPLLLKLGHFERSGRGYTTWLLRTRRLIIVLVMAAAYGVYSVMGASSSLADLGWLSLAGLAQLTPALLGGLYWKNATRLGVSIGMTAGLAIWAYTLLVPLLVHAHVLPQTLLSEGPFGIGWLSPIHPFGIAISAPFTQGVMLSIAVNLFCYIFFSQLSRPGVVERIQASLFVESASVQPNFNRPWAGTATIDDLKALCQRFLSSDQVERAFNDYATRQGAPLPPGAHASIDAIQFSERLLASAVGSSSARILVNSALSHRGIELSDVVSIVDEASQVLDFNRSLLQSTLENLHQGISVVDHTQRLVVWNRRYLQLFSFPDNLIRVGTPFEKVFRYNAQRGEYGPGDPEEHVAQLMENLHSGKPHHYQRYRKDGTVLDIQGYPMSSGGFVYTYQDITQQKRTEEALIRSESNIRIYTDNVPALIAYFDPECRYLFTNRAYETVMHIDRTEVIGKRANDIMSAREWKSRAPWMRRALAGERVTFELSMDDREGGMRYMLVTYTPHLGIGSRVLGFFALYQDITDRRLAEMALKETNEHLEERVRDRTRELSSVNEALRNENEVRAQAEQALRQAMQIAESANASKTRFLAAASHDLLQPLNAARLFTSALTQRLSESEHLSTLNHIDSSLQSAEELLSTLLDISKLDAGALTPKRRQFSLSQVITPLQSQFDVMAGERGLEFHVVMSHAMIDSDPQMLQRIIQNFISNALRYTQQGRVLLGCRRQGDSILIEVWDTGPGIPESKQSEIFQEFRRLDQQSRHRESEKGLGLGLSIADRMAKVLEHSLSLRSEVGRGTVFSLRVPWLKGVVQSEAAAEPKRPTAANKLKGTRVICIDNETLTLEGMRAILEGWECEVHTATTIGGAKSVLRHLHGAPDAILADYHLDNEVTGLMALDALDERMEGDVPGIVITADRTEEVADLVKRAGYHLLNKPVKPAALRALLTRLLQAQRNKSRLG